MTTINLEPRGASRYFTADLPVPPTYLSSSESTAQTRHEAKAFGHIVAAKLCSLLPNDYHKRTLVDITTTNLGLTPVLQLKLVGREPLLRSELGALVQAAYDFVVGSQDV